MKGRVTPAEQSDSSSVSGNQNGTEEVSNNQVKPAIDDSPENIPPPPKYQEVVEMNRVSEKAGDSVAMNGFSATNYDKSVDELPEKSANGGKEDKKDGDTDSKADEKKEEETPMVGLFEVFRYSTKRDRLFMILGTLCAMIHGTAFPLMIIVFGEMTDLFVNSGKYEYAVDQLVSLGTLAKLNFTSEQVIKDPDLLEPYLSFITTDTNSTVDISVIKSAITDDLLDTMRTYAFYFIGIGAGVVVLGYGQVMFWMIASERQTHRIRKNFYKNVMRQNIGWFDTHESGELNSRLTSDISKIHDGIGDKIGTFVQWFTAFLAGFTIGFIYGWKLTLVIISISPLLAGAAFIMSKLVGMASGAELKAYAKAGAVAEEVLGAIRTVVAFGGQEKECERYENNLVEAKSQGIKKGLVNGVSMGVVWMILFLAYALGFWYGAKLSRDEPDTYTIGNVLIVFFAVLIGAFSLGNAAPPLQSLAVARGAAYIVYGLIELDPPIDSYSKKGKKLENFQGSISIQDVHFKYPSRPDTAILQGVNLDINRGQTVALVGSSGCGKSTIVQLIQRFYDPEQGSIKIDGTDLKDINIKWWREHIGIVSQEPVLFGTTIGENIRYGREEVSQAEIEEATKMANAHDFITALPDKYDTMVGERGAQLSGGQKQRIAIARALVRDPKILLLDEATSALDTESEGVVQEALEKASHGRTTIVIAHRLSTIKTADVIAGFKDGVIAEKGTHSELMSKNGIYQNLVNRQSMKNEDDAEAELFDAPEKGTPGKKPLTTQHSMITFPDHSKKDAGDKKDDKEKEEEEVNSGLMRVLKMNASEWWIIALGCVGSIINGGLMPAFAVIFAEILGVFAIQDLDEQTRKVNLYVLLFVALAGVSLVSYFLQGYMFGRSGETLTMRLRSMSFRAMLRQEIAYFDDHDNSVGALCTRLSTDASQVQGAAGAKLGSSFMGLCSILTGLIIAFIYSWKLTLLIIAFLPLIMIGGALQMQMLAGAAGKNKEALEAAGKIAIESIENIRTVASLTREKMFRRKFKAELDVPYEEALKKAHVIGISFSVSQGVIFFAYAASFWLGAYLIQQSELDYVAVFKVFSAIVFGGMAIGEASSFAPDAAKAEQSAKEIFKLLDKEPKIDSYSDKGHKLQEEKYRSTIAFSDVKFVYPTRPDTQVLTGLNLLVPQGQTVALVGSSGCGKSTTVQLTERFYDADEGAVYLDGNNLKDLNLKWLRSQIGIVSQEPILFDRSIGENIAYGDNSRKVTMDEIIEAARKANIHQFISSLPEGYDTSVGEKGAQLSGGQKQRVAIARALVRHPKILLLDEATSALDTESEKIVQEALDKAREGRTSIVIAHRLSTIQNADKICVIRHGVVTEEGTHSELMKKQGFYYKLNMAQQRKK
ncbi:ATP-dependent translocase ABCB1-like isoform X2 [Ruditapes philippinarum]|uniref:ATP-dependent translocase ABCB1-like isoform X2 n=1 Tax=Ruditapes philippinarum TaxID=129788 RepID=UPI00295B7737|nr:ATP-dependent translocase ABCB1-like isoform X2 [Ruditapes philippinarum]